MYGGGGMLMFRWLFLVLWCSSVLAMEVVPPGLLASKPIISDATFALIAKKSGLSEKDFTESDLRKLDKKFDKVVGTLVKEGVIGQIGEIALKYGVSPEAVAACIIGEHVFNVTLVDTFQSYFIGIYSQWLDKHNEVRGLYVKFLSEGVVQGVLASGDSDYEKWDTLFGVYNQRYRGRGGYPDKPFLFSFFNPYGAGLTYGLGQLSPVRVLLTNDLAVKHGGLKRIEASDTESLYKATLDVTTNLNYVSASVLASILVYKKYANYDISNNIGVIATLYNLGDEKKRAKQLAKLNETRHSYPSENFYGWYMNKKASAIHALFANAASR